jgi:Ca2+-binding RTX toxin-like protein
MGDDWLSGGVDSDVFVFKADFGKDIIADFRVKGSNHDVIEFENEVFADWSELLRSAINDTCNGAVITLDCDNTITLLNVTKAQLLANHGNLFQFE